MWVWWSLKNSDNRLIDTNRILRQLPSGYDRNQIRTLYSPPYAIRHTLQLHMKHIGKLVLNEGIKDDIKGEVNVQDCLLPKSRVMQQILQEKKLSLHPKQWLYLPSQFPICLSLRPHHASSPANRMESPSNNNLKRKWSERETWKMEHENPFQHHIWENKLAGKSTLYYIKSKMQHIVLILDVYLLYIVKDVIPSPVWILYT